MATDLILARRDVLVERWAAAHAIADTDPVAARVAELALEELRVLKAILTDLVREKEVAAAVRGLAEFERRHRAWLHWDAANRTDPAAVPPGGLAIPGPPGPEPADHQPYDKPNREEN